MSRSSIVFVFQYAFASEAVSVVTTDSAVLSMRNSSINAIAPILASSRDILLSMLANAPYAAVAKQWAEDPAWRIKMRLACIRCQAANRLGPVIERSHQTAQ